jgi:hypothetical protein
MSKLKHPFNYYWKKYMEGKCPFCDADIIHTFENDEIIFCSGYGGYLVIYQDAAIAGRDGLCKQCLSTDPLQDDYSNQYFEETSPYREIIKGQGFLCEECGHGVYFDEMKVFQELFKLHNENTCKHCLWHNNQSPNNPVKKPSN